jgi:hypothetical protein
MEAYERNSRIPHMMLLRLPQSSSDLSRPIPPASSIAA